MKKLLFVFVIVVSTLVFAQVRDAYISNPTLTYTGNNPSRWAVNSNTLRASTGGASGIDYYSTDMSAILSDWSVATDKGNTWTVWMSDTRTSVSGWGSNSYAFAFVLAANNSDLTSTSCQGYALLFKNGGTLNLVKFSQGINANVETNSTNIIASIDNHFGTAGTDTLNGFNLYVKFESDGKWTVKWLKGSKLGVADVPNVTNYTSTQTSSSDDITYTGTNYKYCGYVWNHSTSGSAYSYWDNLGFGYNGVLPVDGLNLSFLVQKEKIALNWQTATEINNKGFEVERNLGNGWQNIGFIEGRGNSNTSNFYSFIDEAKLYGKVLYRLKQIDNDGKFTYSNVIEVNLALPKSVELLQNYPNPFNPTTTISYVLPEAGNVTLKVFNPLGQEVATLINEYQESGIKHVNFDASNLTSGIYYYKIQFGNVVKTNKMILIK